MFAGVFFFLFWFILIVLLFHNNGGTQRPNVSKYVRRVWWLSLCFENPFWLILSSPKSCLSVWMSLGSYGRLERLRWLSPLIRSC